MKKVSKNVLFFLPVLLVIPIAALAQCGVTGDTVEVCNPLKFSTVEGVLGSLLNALQGVIVVLAIVFLIVGAFFYITSAGNEQRVTTAKKAITASMIGLAIGVAAPSFLKEIYIVLGGNAEINCTACQADPTSPDCTSCQAQNNAIQQAPSIVDIVLRVLNFLLSVFGTLALIMLVIGGVMYLTSAGDEKRVDTAKKIVKFSIIGIVVTLASLVIVRTIATFFG